VTEQVGEARARLDLVFARRADRTVLDRRLFRWPFVLTRTFALDRAPSHMLTVILQTSSGAMHGEDRLVQRFHVRNGAAAHVTTQGASPVHRADPGLTTDETITIRVEEGGYLEYLPEPRILFPDAALAQTTEIDCAEGSVALVSDAFTIHDPEARGRCFRRLTSATILRCGGGEPVLVDRLDIGGLPRGRTAQFKAFGSVLLAAPGLTEGIEALADDLSAALAAVPGLYGAASRLPGEASGIGVRLAGRDLRAVRAGIHSIWISVRRRLFGAAPPSRRKGDELPRSL
jgi:urease accessory protein